jgi:hypothetical protein
MKQQPKRELGAAASAALAATPLLAQHFTAGRAGRRSAAAPWNGLEEPQEAAFTRGETRGAKRRETRCWLGRGGRRAVETVEAAKSSSRRRQGKGGCTKATTQLQDFLGTELS